MKRGFGRVLGGRLAPVVGSANPVERIRQMRLRWLERRYGNTTARSTATQGEKKDWKGGMESRYGRDVPLGNTVPVDEKKDWKGGMKSWYGRKKGTVPPSNTAPVNEKKHTKTSWTWGGWSRTSKVSASDAERGQNIPTVRDDGIRVAPIAMTVNKKGEKVSPNLGTEAKGDVVNSSVKHVDSEMVPPPVAYTGPPYVDPSGPKVHSVSVGPEGQAGTVMRLPDRERRPY